MNLIALIVYFLINGGMVLVPLFKKERLYEFPFWCGVVSLGWFFPQAMSLYSKQSALPDGAYAAGLFFATLCTVALWIGFVQGRKKGCRESSWLNADFAESRLHFAGAYLCMFGFYFMWKLSQLPDEVLNSTQWTGAPVKYLFLASVFKFGFITLLLIYLSKRKLLAPRLLIFIIPSLLLMLHGAIMGRRAIMMDVFSFVFMSLWFVRRVTLPRGLVIAGLAAGMLVVNAIGLYRGIMSDRDMSLNEKISQAINANYVEESKSEVLAANTELCNYLYSRQVYAENGIYDLGAIHWNLFIFNYVPGQLIGRDLKASLMVPLKNIDDIVQQEYGYARTVGSTSTGYLDAFGSFGWLGFVKFMLAGYIMGILYRHALDGAFLGQVLYIYSLSSAMLIVTHDTNDILLRIWIYFFALAYPALYLARVRSIPLSLGLSEE